MVSELLQFLPLRFARALCLFEQNSRRFVHGLGSGDRCFIDLLCLRELCVSLLFLSLQLAQFRDPVQYRL